MFRIQTKGVVGAPQITPNHLDTTPQETQPNSWLMKQSKASSKLFLYMLASIPVIVSDFSIKEIIVSEKCGISVDPTNPSEIAEAIVYLIKNPKEAKKMGISGRKAIEKKYNWEIMERRLIKAYQNIFD